MLVDQQDGIINPFGLISWLETHERISDDPIEGVWNNHRSTLIWTVDCSVST